MATKKTTQANGKLVGTDSADVLEIWHDSNTVLAQGGADTITVYVGGGHKIFGRYGGDTVTIKSSPSAKDSATLKELAETVSASVLGSSKLQKNAEKTASKKWVCTICGYVYEGDKLPEDYKCPLCGAGVKAFKEA